MIRFDVTLPLTLSLATSCTIETYHPRDTMLPRVDPEAAVRILQAARVPYVMKQDPSGQVTVFVRLGMRVQVLALLNDAKVICWPLGKNGIALGAYPKERNP